MQRPAIAQTRERGRERERERVECEEAKLRGFVLTGENRAFLRGSMKISGVSEQNCGVSVRRATKLWRADVNTPLI